VRILLVHPGPLPEFSVQDVLAGWQEALEELGCIVQVFNTNDRLTVYDSMLIDTGAKDTEGRPLVRKAVPRDDAIRLAMQGLYSACYTFWPDVVLAVSAFFTPPQMLDVLRSRRHKVVLVHTECPYQDSDQLDRAAHADLNLLNDPVSLDAFRALGIPAEYVPHAYRPAVHKPGPVVRELACDLSFVGTGYHSRVDFFEAMDLGGLDVILAGNWQALKTRPGSPLLKYLSHDIDHCLTNDETVRVYNSSKAGINFYRREGSADHEAPALQGVAMGPREVEMAASGLWFLRDPRPEGDAVLPMLPVFASPEDAGEQLRWWLDRDSQREDAARAARAAVSGRTFASNAEMLLRLLDRQPVTI
jgi:spore maturation protein CgeB